MPAAGLKDVENNCDYYCSAKILLPPIFYFHFEEAVRVNPFLPQRGKQSQGSITLTPLSISPVSKGNFSSPP
jgi:hypothetical protein